MVRHSLVVRLDNAGDVLLAGPLVRAVAAGSDRVTLLVGPHGAEAARLLPGVDDVLVWRCPWIDPQPGPVRADDIAAVVAALSERQVDRALVLTSFHQSPLPTALLLRLAGVPWVGAVSDDYPGTLLDLRHRIDSEIDSEIDSGIDGELHEAHEVRRALSLGVAAGYRLPRDDDGRLAVLRPLPEPPREAQGHYVVLHPGTSVPARAWPAERHTEACRMLTDRGHRVLVTGARAEQALTARVVDGTDAVDLGGRTTLAELAAVLDRAVVVVAGNTGPAHLAAAVGTPVVSLFAPTVPAVRWRPYGVPTVLLGDQDAVCRDSRVTTCPFEGHPCLASVDADSVVQAVEQLSGRHPIPDGLVAQEV
jgi:ADP-heptose:LPS heptosyltransferase